MVDKNMDAQGKSLATRPVFVGGVQVGGGAPVRVQSMCNTRTEDVEATLAQIQRFAQAGCELVRVAVPSKGAVEGFARICQESCLPVIADIHFDYRLALAAIQAGAQAIRINPGNIGDFDKVDAIIQAAKDARIPIRIGVNAGSLSKEISRQAELSMAEKLVASARQFVEYFHERGFFDLVVSAKAHDVQVTFDTYRMLHEQLPQVPLHLGVTEAGTFVQGTVKSAIALGGLLLEGIGDTIRVSLTDDPEREVEVAWEILQACGLRRRTPELISCPTCGRCQVDLIDLARQIDARLKTMEKPISVACMGCVVNGPGEAQSADIGVACGKGQGLLFAKGQVIGKAPEDQIVDALFEEIERRF